MGNKVTIISTLTLFIIVAWFGYSFFQTVFISDVPPPPQASQTQSNVNNTNPISSTDASADNISPTKNIKQSIPATEKAPAQVTEKASAPPPTKHFPPVRLKIQSLSKNAGIAIILYEGGTPRSYSVGSNLSDGVILKSMTDSEIIVDNHGNLEKVIMPKAAKLKLPDPDDQGPARSVGFNNPPPFDTNMEEPNESTESNQYNPPPADDGTGPYNR